MLRGSRATFPCRIRRMGVPVACALSIRSSSSPSPGCGARSASPPVSSRRTPSSRRVSVSASRAVEAIASRRPPASAESSRRGSVVQPRSRWRSPTDDAPRCHGALGRCGRALPSPSVRECSPPSLPGSRRGLRPPGRVCASTRRRRARRRGEAVERRSRSRACDRRIAALRERRTGRAAGRRRGDRCGSRAGRAGRA